MNDRDLPAAWRLLADGPAAWFDAPSHAAGAALVTRLAGQADRLDLELRQGGVRVRIVPADSGPTADDTALAQSVSAAAEDLGLPADPAALQSVSLVLEALDRPAVTAFWRTVLGYDVGGDALVDPGRRDPRLLIRPQDQPRTLRNRIHLDVARPQAVTREVVDTVTAQGAIERQSNDWYATLADADGNEVDVIPIGPYDTLGDGPDTADWRALFGAMTCYPVTSPAAGAELAAAVAELADTAGFPLLIDLRPGRVTVDTGKDQGEDSRFQALAPRIQATARDLGLRADPAALRFVQIGIDAVDLPAVQAFWLAVLHYDRDPRGPTVTDIVDPRRLDPVLFFQPMPESERERRRQRNRIHVALSVPADAADTRLETALASGGRIVEAHPGRSVVADPEGNELVLTADPS